MFKSGVYNPKPKLKGFIELECMMANGHKVKEFVNISDIKAFRPNFDENGKACGTVIVHDHIIGVDLVVEEVCSVFIDSVDSVFEKIGASCI